MPASFKASRMRSEVAKSLRAFASARYSRRRRIATSNASELEAVCVVFRSPRTSPNTVSNRSCRRFISSALICCAPRVVASISCATSNRTAKAIGVFRSLQSASQHLFSYTSAEKLLLALGFRCSKSCHAFCKRSNPLAAACKASLLKSSVER